METLDLIQGTPEWHAHRATHDNASDAPVMLGLSNAKTREELLHERHTGISKLVSDYVEDVIYANGHKFEALARPLAEDIIGEPLYPVTGCQGTLSASYDGLTALDDAAYEHKTLNAELRAIMSRPGCTGADLPELYRAQMEQQCMVAGCRKVLFVASEWDEADNLVESYHCWYTADDKLAEKILMGWDQFHRDLKAYVPREAKPKTFAEAIEALPALSVQVEGRVVASNLDGFREAALQFIANINTDLQTDQDFANAAAMVKFCEDSEAKLEQVKAAALAQTQSIDALFRTIDAIRSDMRQKRLTLNSLVETRKQKIRDDIVAEGRAELTKHVAGLNTRLSALLVTLPPVSLLSDAIKGKRTLESLRTAVDHAVTQAKLDLSAKADAFELNRRVLVGEGHDWMFLFADFATVGAKPAEDFAAIAQMRIHTHEEMARAKREAEQRAAEAKVYVPPAPAPVVSSPAVAAPPARSAGGGTYVDKSLPPITNGQLCEMLGFAVTVDFVRSLGFVPTATPKGGSRAGTYWAGADFPAICDALIRHVTTVKAKGL